MNREIAEKIVRAECQQECRAFLCELNNRCMALQYDTPGFCERIEAKMVEK
jgi:hypothetical protein